MRRMLVLELRSLRSRAAGRAAALRTRDASAARRGGAAVAVADRPAVQAAQAAGGDRRLPRDVAPRKLGNRRHRVHDASSRAPWRFDHRRAVPAQSTLPEIRSMPSRWWAMPTTCCGSSPRPERAVAVRDEEADARAGCRRRALEHRADDLQAQRRYRCLGARRRLTRPPRGGRVKGGAGCAPPRGGAGSGRFLRRVGVQQVDVRDGDEVVLRHAEASRTRRALRLRRRLRRHRGRARLPAR